MGFKKIILLAIFSLTIFKSILAQATYAVTDPQRRYKELKEMMVREQYGLAYPVAKELKMLPPDQMQQMPAYYNEDVSFYSIVSGLRIGQAAAVDDAETFIHDAGNQPRIAMLSFHLGHYYFLKEEHEKTIVSFERAGYENLSNEQIADAKFEKAYAYFSLKRYAEARPLFEEISQLNSHHNYMAANYYNGFIAYYEKRYAPALKSFKLVETDVAYAGVVPYYIAEIYYFQGKKDEASQYGESIVNRGGTVYNELQLNLLLGQLAFEKKDYKKALPLLEEYVDRSSRVSKEVLYELSYCYFINNQSDKAIEGFKQLSNERDSMGQNSMYLLGSLYLKKNQKENARNAFQYSAFNSSNVTQQTVSRFNYAKLSYELGYQDIALSEMKKYLGDYPDSENDSEAKEILVNLLANTNDFRSALQIYESLKPPTPGMRKVLPRILYGRAIEFLNDQQLNSAEELLNKLIADPEAGGLLSYANFWKGEIAHRQQRYDEAIRCLTIFIESNASGQGEATPELARYNLGYSWFQKQNFANALTHFEKVARNVSVTSTPVQQDAYMRSADCYYMLRDFTKAASMYDFVINNALAQSDYALYQKAMIAGIKSSTEKVRTLTTIGTRYPKSMMLQDINMEIALTHIADEKFREAVPFLNAIIASGEGGLKPAAHLKLGLAWYNANDNTNALNAYQQLIEQYPRSSEAQEALVNIRDIYIEEGKPNEYLALMQKNGVNVSVSEADSLTYSAGWIKYNANDCLGAISAFANYLEKFSAGGYVLEANYFSAECHRKQREWPEALRNYALVNSKGQSRYFERATLEAARISYFEIKNYTEARKYFESLRANAISQENRMEALRGLVRSYFQLKEYSTGNEVARELLTQKGINTDDRSIAFLVLGKSQQAANNCADAVSAFRSVAAINKAAWGAEARFELARCLFIQNSFTQSEKAAMSVIRETGSYDEWVTKSYILLGDIFMQQKDYFNAKATYESVARNATITELKNEAQEKLDKAVAAEKESSKLNR